jgi:hypothetical protein
MGAHGEPADNDEADLRRHERGEQPLGVERRHRRQVHALVLFVAASYRSRSSRNRRVRAFAAS